jgi:hypothetical protein
MLWFGQGSESALIQLNPDPHDDVRIRNTVDILSFHNENFYDIFDIFSFSYLKFLLLISVSNPEVPVQQHYTYRRPWYE